MGGSSMVRAQEMPSYDEVLATLRARFNADNAARSPGDPALAAKVLLDMVDTSDPPLRLLLGNAAVDLALSAYHARLETWRAWEAVRQICRHRGSGFLCRPV